MAKDTNSKPVMPQTEKVVPAEQISNSSGTLSPLHTVIVITEEGIKELAVEDISSERIGWKAYGISSLSSEWVPPFFVITASCFEQSSSDEIINNWATECLSRVGIRSGHKVIVRSSGTLETIQYRGQLKSASCLPREIATTIRNLIPQLPHIPSGKVHWIVQGYVNPNQQGHLSNERHVRKDHRDWLVEFESQGDRPGYTESIAVRRWRDGTELTNLDLHCTSELEVTLRLKRVAMWAMSLSSRCHFEWVRNDKAIYMVQADLAEHATGINPRSLLHIDIQSIELASLQVFHPAGQEDFERYSKLRNAKLYGELNYRMPNFYVVDDPKIINAILSGQIPSELEEDLAELTKRSLIIRTDGVNIPPDEYEMLPRSVELRSKSKAVNWLVTDFKSKIEEKGLKESQLCLIAHYFIPSVASAWARAEPSNRIVRIESLWGIPEGLYWYSHDTFEVDTLTSDIGFSPSIGLSKYNSWSRLRYKGTFIAPNEKGEWISCQPTPPYDWTKSISKKKWLFEIAYTTRKIAEYEKYPVSVMWFIDNHPQATAHKVLPWFHSKSELTDVPKAAPRQKRKSARDYRIKSDGDWQQLQQDLQSGKYIERVVVEPIDPSLIRNDKFAKELAELAASKKFVVELAGGILSHAYYILQSRGARVECIDLFGADEDTVDYNKVVRDKIPSIIEARGERVEIYKLEGKALIAALRKKLIEEAFEVLDAKSGEELVGELADVEEIIRALCQILGVSVDEVEEEREQKRKRRGGFEKGLMLIKTTAPHSISNQASVPDPTTLGLKVQPPSEPVISDLADLPSKPMYRRPDLRQVNQDLEKLFTFETETNKIGEIKETLDFSMPIDSQRHRDFTLTVELKRTRSSLRGVVRLRLLPPQLRLEFPDSRFPDSQLEFEFPE